MPLYDYLYVDLPKVISLYSQLIGGVVETREVSKESVESADNKRHYDFKIFKHDAGGTDQDKSGVKEIIKPHHSVLVELEEELASNGYLIDLTAETTHSSFRNQEVRANLKNTLCLKICGRAVIEHYERIKSIAQVFPEVAKLINRSAASNLRQSAEFLQLQSGIKEIEENLKSNKNRNERSAKEQQLKTIKKALNDQIENAGKVAIPDQWILDGLGTWIDTFLPGILNLRVYPSNDHPDEHVFGHLKKAYFEDSDTHSFHFTYGSLPTESLTMLGVISAVPDENGDNFRPLAEFEKEALADYESVEMGFRGVFRGFDGIEQVIRTLRFPRVLVYPLTVYRSVESNPAVLRTRQKTQRR
jgi:hypothetical protein